MCWVKSCPCARNCPGPFHFNFYQELGPCQACRPKNTAQIWYFVLGTSAKPSFFCFFFQVSSKPSDLDEKSSFLNHLIPVRISAKDVDVYQIQALKNKSLTKEVHKLGC